MLKGQIFFGLVLLIIIIYIWYTRQETDAPKEEVMMSLSLSSVAEDTTNQLLISDENGNISGSNLKYTTNAAGTSLCIGDACLYYDNNTKRLILNTPIDISYDGGQNIRVFGNPDTNTIHFFPITDGNTPQFWVGKAGTNNLRDAKLENITSSTINSDSINSKNIKTDAFLLNLYGRKNR